VKTNIFFFGRIILAWLLMFIATSVFFNMTGLDGLMDIVVFLFWVSLILLLLAAASHLHHVQLIDGAADIAKLKNRHRRQIEIPFEEEIALPMLEACLRELPGIDNLKISQNGKRLQGRVIASDRDKETIHFGKKPTRSLVLKDTTTLSRPQRTSMVALASVCFAGRMAPLGLTHFFLMKAPTCKMQKQSLATYRVALPTIVVVNKH